MFGSKKKTIWEDGVTIEVEITSASVVKVKITDQKNRQVVVDIPHSNAKINTDPPYVLGRAYC